MKAIISTTFDDQYLFYLPITTWCWNKLNVDVICFVPYGHTHGDEYKGNLVVDTCKMNGLKIERHHFSAPKHKEATYAQCSRLYGACLDLPEDEVLIVGDIDMGVFKLPDGIEYAKNGFMHIFGHDLVPQGQVPMCYLFATVAAWRRIFWIEYGSMTEGGEAKYNFKTYQEKLDELLGGIECDNFRGNYWAKDQEEAFNRIHAPWARSANYNRARPGTQFASRRYDRDDAYILDRLSPDTIDFHMNRPGYTDANFEIILKIIQYHYPNEDLTWMRAYQEAYKKLL